MGTIFDIKRFAVHDGPGIRTTVFFKGCPLRCRLCHNPESQHFEKERFYRGNRCVGCDTCIETCQADAVSRKDDVITYDADLCRLCGDCAEACGLEAVELIGREIEAPELWKIIERDRIFFDESGGGVTFSGGEPLSQPEFLIKLLKLCREGGIHTTVDTSGLAEWDVIDQVRRHADLFLYDLKSMDASRHLELTRVSNEKILDNLSRLCEARANVIIRFPLIPGVNDDKASLNALGTFVASLPTKPLMEILPLHSLGQEKYERLGRESSMKGAVLPTDEMYDQAAEVLQSFDVKLILKGN